MEEVTVRLVCGVGLAVVAPAILALEMFYKGGRAAIELERDGKMLLGERADDMRRVEEEFNSYRIKREQEFKDIEDNRGKEIARLQATIAELESSINSSLIVEPVEKLADNDATFRVTLVVRNDSPLAANNVSVVVDSIQVIK